MNGSDDDDGDTEAAANEILARMSRDGVAVSTVRDGVILAITRATLEKLLDDMKSDGHSEAIIFVQVGTMAETMAETMASARGIKAS